MKLWKAVYTVNGASSEKDLREEDFYLPEEADVRRVLRARGHWPVRIVERREALFTFGEVRSSKWALQILRSLRFLSAANSAEQSLLDIAEKETDPHRRVAMLPVRTVLRGGGSFSTALKSLRMFDATTMAILVAGERIGGLRAAIPYAVKHIEEKKKTVRAVLSALGMLSFDILTVLSSVVGTHFGYIPWLRTEGLNGVPPAKRVDILAQIDRVETVNFVLMLVMGLLTAFAGWLVVEMVRNRHRTDHLAARIVRRLPIVGPYLRDLSMAESCGSFVRLVKGGVPMDESIRIVADNALAPEVREYWISVERRIASGMPPQRAMAIDPMSRLERDHLASCQTTEQIADAMETVTEERLFSSKDSQRRVMLSGIVFLVVSSTAVVLIGIWLIMIQNSGLFESINTH